MNLLRLAQPPTQHLDGLILLHKTEEYPSNPYSRHFASTVYQFCLLLPEPCCSTLYLLSRLLPILDFCNVERDSLCNNNRPISILSISHRSHSGLHNMAGHHTHSSRNHTTHHHSLYLSHCHRPPGSNHRCDQVSHSHSSRQYSLGNLRCLHSSPIHHYRTLSTST